MEAHPFRAAWETRDVDVWVDALAPDVVLRSPALTTQFRGLDAAAELYDVLFDAFGGFELTHELSDGDLHVFFWRGELGRRWIEGVDLLRSGGDGKIVEVTVFIRPLVDVATFVAAVGPSLARRRGPIRALATRLLTLPLRGLLAVADAVAPRLTQRR